MQFFEGWNLRVLKGENGAICRREASLFLRARGPDAVIMGDEIDDGTNIGTERGWPCGNPEKWDSSISNMRDARIFLQIYFFIFLFWLLRILHLANGRRAAIFRASGSPPTQDTVKTALAVA